MHQETNVKYQHHIIKSENNTITTAVLTDYSLSLRCSSVRIFDRNKKYQLALENSADKRFLLQV